MLTSLLIFALNCPPECQDLNPEDSAVKVFSTIREPDFDRPWAKKKPVEIVGSAVVLAGGLLVTNAHVVDYAQRVELLPNGATERYEAEVLHLSYEDDLALVRPIDDSFFDTFPSVELSTALPVPGSEVIVAGFPEGGDELSKTTGNVNRYVYRRAGGFQGLSIQVDASINEGNSGGPVFQDGKVIGIAFQKNKSARADNIGYVIPGETVQRFLDDAEDGQVEGTRSLRISWSRCENPVMRKHLGISKEQDGVILYPSSSWTPENFAIKPLDVLLEIAGHNVDNYGRIQLSDAGMIEWEYMIPWAGASGVLPLTILRNKEVLQLEAETILEVPRRIVRLDGRYPSYYIYGPVTFVELSAEHLNRFNAGIMFQNQISGWPGILETRQSPTPEYQRVVSANYNLLSHRIAKGYESPLALPVLRKVNGIPIKDLKDLASILENMESATVFFEFDNRGQHSVRNFDREGKQDFVFDHKEVLRTREEILEEAGIRRYYSKDLADVIQD